MLSSLKNIIEKKLGSTLEALSHSVTKKGSGSTSGYFQEWTAPVSSSRLVCSNDFLKGWMREEAGILQANCCGNSFRTGNTAMVVPLAQSPCRAYSSGVPRRMDSNTHGKDEGNTRPVHGSDSGHEDPTGGTRFQTQQDRPSPVNVSNEAPSWSYRRPPDGSMLVDTLDTVRLLGSKV